MRISYIYFISTTSIDHQLSLEVKNKLELLQVDKQMKIFISNLYSYIPH